MATSETVIIALKYEGGAILAADSQATDDFAQVRWEVEKPFQIPSYPCVIAMSGSEGMSDRVKGDLLSRRWHWNTFDKRDRVRDALDGSFIKVYKTIEDRNRKIPLWGLTVSSAEDSTHILEHELSGDCCFHPHFHAIGSGAPTAYAIYRTLGGRDLVKLGEQKAILAALRILRTCVGVERAGVSDSFHMWVVKGAIASHLTDDRIQAELQYVDEWEEQNKRAFFDS